MPDFHQLRLQRHQLQRRLATAADPSAEFAPRDRDPGQPSHAPGAIAARSAAPVSGTNDLTLRIQ
jgi:hypothetical protein